MKQEIEKYVAEIEQAYKDSKFWGRSNNPDAHKFTVEYGRKFAKIMHNAHGSNGVHCFVELSNGNIHKAATFKAPQKNGVRGNLKDEKRPLFDCDYYVIGTNGMR